MGRIQVLPANAVTIRSVNGSRSFKNGQRKNLNVSSPVRKPLVFGGLTNSSILNFRVNMILQQAVDFA